MPASRERPPILAWAFGIAIGLSFLALYFGLPLNTMYAYGDLRPFPQSPDPADYFQGWHLAGLGNTEQRPPAELVTALIIELFGQPVGLQHLVLLTEIPIAFLSMYVLGRRLFKHRLTRMSVALFYAINPLTLQEFAGGAIGLFWIYAWLPIIADSTIAVIEEKSLRSAARLTLSAAIASVFFPHAALFVFGPVVIFLAVSHFTHSWQGRNEQMRIGPILVISSLYVALLLPSFIDLVVGYFRVSGSLSSLTLDTVAFTYADSQPWNAFRLLAVAWPSTPLALAGYGNLTPWGLAASIIPVAAFASPLVVGHQARRSYIFRAVYFLAVAVVVIDVAGFLGLLSPVFVGFPALLAYSTPVKLNYALAFALTLLLGYFLAGVESWSKRHRHSNRVTQPGRGDVRIRIVGASAVFIIVFTASTPFLGGMQLAEYYGPSGYTVNDDVISAHAWLNSNRNSLSDFRSLWLPLDYGTFLKYHGLEEFTFDSPLTASLRGGSFTAIDYVRNVLAGVCRGDPSLPVGLGLASVKYVVVLNDVAQYPGCLEQDAFLYTNSEYLNQFFQHLAGFSTAAVTSDYRIYQNQYFLPQVSAYSRIISAESIPTVERRVLTGPNLVADPAFQQGLDHWIALGGNESRVESDCFMNSNCVEVRSSDEGVAQVVQRIDIVGGVTYNVSFWWRLEDAPDAYVRVLWYNNPNAAQGQSIATTNIGAPLEGTTGWRKVGLSVKAPPGAVRGDFQFAATTVGNPENPSTAWLALPSVRPLFINPGGFPDYVHMVSNAMFLPSFSVYRDLVLPTDLTPVPLIQPEYTIYINGIPGTIPSNDGEWISIIEPNRSVIDAQGYWEDDVWNGSIRALSAPTELTLGFEAPKVAGIRIALLLPNSIPVESIDATLNSASLTVGPEFTFSSTLSWWISNSTSLLSGQNQILLRASAENFSLIRLVIIPDQALVSFFLPAPSTKQLVIPVSWNFSRDSGYEVTQIDSSAVALRISQAFSDRWEASTFGGNPVHTTDGTFNIFAFTSITEPVRDISVRYQVSAIMPVSFILQAIAWIAVVMLAALRPSHFESALNKVLPLDSESDLWVRANRNRLTKRLQTSLTVQPGQRILDLGSGPGYYASRIREISRHKARVVACDVSRACMLSLIRAFPGITAVQADARALPFRSKQFHRVFSKDLLHHVQEPREIVSEIARVTSAEGGCVLVEANATHPFMRVLAEHDEHRHMTQMEFLRLVESAFCLEDAFQVEANPLFYYIRPHGSPMLALWDSVWAVFQVLTRLFPPFAFFVIRLEEKAETSANWRGRLAFNVIVGKPDGDRITAAEQNT